jgi:hypothetical protein
MPVSLSFRCRPVRQLIPLLVIGAALAGCAGISDTISPAFVDPARYQLWDCKQLASERKTLATRLADLERLMAKAETGTGGTVVAELAYRNDYVSVRGQQKLLEEAWQKNRCRESDLEVAAPAATPTPPFAPAAAAKRSRPRPDGTVN